METSASYYRLFDLCEFTNDYNKNIIIIVIIYSTANSPPSSLPEHIIHQSSSHACVFDDSDSVPWVIKIIAARTTTVRSMIENPSVCTQLLENENTMSACLNSFLNFIQRINASDSYIIFNARNISPKKLCNETFEIC